MGKLFVDSSSMKTMLNQHAIHISQKDDVAAAAMPTVSGSHSDEIVDIIVGNNTGLVRDQECQYCHELFSCVKLHDRYCASNPNRARRIRCDDCGKLISRHRLKAHKRNMHQNKDASNTQVKIEPSVAPENLPTVVDVNAIVEMMMDVIGGVNSSNLQEFMHWYELTVKMINTNT